MNNAGKEKQILERYFKGLKVREATTTLHITPNGNDIRWGRQGDPRQCVIARACKRLYNSTAVVILRRTAYVDLINPANGKVELFRFEIKQSQASAVAMFDLLGKFPDGGIKLTPMPPSRKLERMRVVNQQRYAALVGTKRAKGSKSSRGKDILTLEGVRNGTGLVHFK